MAVPKKKTSRERRDKRRSHLALKAPGIAECSHCKQPKQPHRVCSNCGYYDGKEVVLVED